MTLRGNIKILSLLMFVVVFATCLYGMLSETISLKSLADEEAELYRFKEESPILTYSAAFLAYVLLTGLSLPVATFLTLLYGWFFGFWKGLLLVSFASTAGATLAMLLSRYFLREIIQNRFRVQLHFVNEATKRDGAYYLFMLCLIPTIPFVLVNALMGLTSIRTFTFWWVSQLGMLIGTILYVYAGATIPSLRLLAEEGVQALYSPSELIRISLALTLVGCCPILTRCVLRYFGVISRVDLMPIGAGPENSP